MFEVTVAEKTGEKKAVENEFTITLKSKAILQEELAAEKERSLALEKEVEEKEGQIKLVLDKLEKEIAARHRAETQLILAVKEKMMLETKLKQFSETPEAIELEKVVVKVRPELAGKVLMVDEKHDFIVINLGRTDNLKLGGTLSVYRNGKFIGRVQVEKVEERISAAAIMPQWQDVKFEENDEVREI